MYFKINISKIEGKKKPDPKNTKQAPLEKKGENKNNEFQWKRAGKTSLIWVMILMVAISLSGLLTTNDQSVEIQYFQYREFLETRQIVSADIIESVFYGEFSTPQSIPKGMTILENVSKFHVILPFIDREVMAEWDAYDVNYSFKGKSIDWTGYFLNLLPWILIIGIWIFFIRRMQGGAGGGMGGIFNFGKSKAKIWTSDMPKITFDDVAGCVEAKEELKEVIDFLKKPKRFQKLGAQIPKGALLIGPPGTGKTLLARAVAGEADVPFFNLSGAEFVEMFVGVGASRVRDLFEQGKKNTPCIIFIDELDAVGRHRGAGLGGGHDEREQTLNQLLVEMDGFESNQMVIVLAATNRPDILDPALLRPGRFDRQIYVDLPELNERKEIFEVHLAPLKKDKELDVDFLAKQTPGFSGADIANMCNEAALIAARKDKNQVEKQDFLDAVDRIIGGLEKKNKIISKKEREVIAFHEAGHATVSWMLEYASPLVKVTIVPRGRSLGAAWYLPEERQLTTTEQLLDELCAALGGRAAEDVFFNRISTGALSDLEKVTKMAYAMVSVYGMNEKVGNRSYYDSSGQDYSFTKPYSEATAKVIDEEVSKLIEKAYTRAKSILGKHKKQLMELAELLLDKEVIYKENLETIFGKRQWTSFEEEKLLEMDKEAAKKEKKPKS